MDIVDPAIDFLALAASMGIPARRIDRAADIAPALEAAISSRVPNLIRRRQLSWPVSDNYLGR
jgi:benzoylformate decarboxylase